MEGEGFEPSKPEAPDLQSGPFDRSGIPPATAVLLIKLSFPLVLSWQWDSNPQPADYKSAALPIELRQRLGFVSRSLLISDI